MTSTVHIHTLSIMFLYLCMHVQHVNEGSIVVLLFVRSHLGTNESWSHKQVISDEGEVNATFVTNKTILTKEVVFHKGGLSKGVLLYSYNIRSICSTASP